MMVDNNSTIDGGLAGRQRSTFVLSDRKNRSGLKAIGLYVFAFLIVSASSGLVYGWPSLRRQLVNEEGSSLSEKSLGVIVTVGSWSTQFFCFFFGVARDRCLGTKWSTCVSVSCCAAGFLGLALSSADNAASLTISMVFVGMGRGSQVSLQPVVDLFPGKMQGALLASLSGAFQISGLVFMALSSLTPNRKAAFSGFMGVLLCLAIVGYFVLPRTTFTLREITETKRESTELSSDHEVVENRDFEAQESGQIVSTTDNIDRETKRDDMHTQRHQNDTEKEQIRVPSASQNETDDMHTQRYQIQTEQEQICMSSASQNETDDMDTQWYQNRTEQQQTSMPSASQKKSNDMHTQRYQIDYEQEQAIMPSASQNETYDMNTQWDQNRIEQQQTSMPSASQKESDDMHTQWYQNQTKQEQTTMPSASQQEQRQGENADDQSVRTLLFSSEYILLVIWFTIHLVPTQYYYATIGYQLEQKGDDDGKYTRLFSVLYAASALSAPFVGKVADVYGLGIAQACSTLMTALPFFLLSVNAIPLGYHTLGMFLYGVSNIFFFGNYYTNVGKRFGYLHYGTLAGLGLLLAGIATLFQYPLIAVATDGTAAWVNIGCGIAMVCTLPYCMWLALRERREQQARP